jgi:cobalt-zinc-cadmium efflux system outer membrane protein
MTMLILRFMHSAFLFLSIPSYAAKELRVPEDPAGEVNGRNVTNQAVAKGTTEERELSEVKDPRRAKSFPSLTPLTRLLEKAYDRNPQLKALQSESVAEERLIHASSFLEDPMFGVSRLQRGSETTYGVISQKIKFPVKSHYQKMSQRHRARAKNAEFGQFKFRIRQQVINTYYQIYAVQKIIVLTKANMEALREFARVAERKYAAGKASQGDSMKAHFELTGLELDLIRHNQLEGSLQSRLKALVSDANMHLTFELVELEAPLGNQNLHLLTELNLRRTLQDKAGPMEIQKHKLAEAKSRSAMAKWEYAPDFQLQYQKRISGLPEDSETVTATMSFPLWYWRKSSEADFAAVREIAQEYRYQSEMESLMATIIDLKGKVLVGQQTLDIYKTSLIPQAEAAYNSSKAAYRASKTSFLDLLDSERSLFRVKTGYYQALQNYIGDLVALEAELGFGLSDFAKIERKAK